MTRVKMVEQTADGNSKGIRRGRVETVGRYSFAVSAVVIYLKPLAVNISSSFIQRLGSFSTAGVYALLRSSLPTNQPKNTERLFHVQSILAE